MLYFIWAYSDGFGGRDGLIVCTHGDHIHVVHGCKSHVCRHQEKRRPLGGAWKTYEASPSVYGPEHLRNLWAYLVQGQRKVLFWSNGTTNGTGGWIYHRTEDLPDCGGEKVPGDDFWTIGACFGRISGKTQGEVLESISNGDVQSMGKEEVVNVIWEKAVEEWCGDAGFILRDPDIKKKYLRKLTYSKDKTLEYVDNYFKLMIEDMEWYTFDDYRRILYNSNPSFGKPRNRMLSRHETFEALQKWLPAQFGDLWKDEFMTFVNIFDRNNGKQNTLAFQGPVSCGKTWFFEMFAALGISVGRLLGHERGMIFGFSDLVNKRIAIADEYYFPLGSSEHIEKMKMLTAGSGALVNVKHKSLQQVGYPPMFMAANEDLFKNIPNQRHFFVPERVYYKYLHSCPDLKIWLKGKQFGNPLALFDIFDLILEQPK